MGKQSQFSAVYSFCLNAGTIHDPCVIMATVPDWKRTSVCVSAITDAGGHMDKYLPQVTALYTYDGSYYAIPKDYDTIALWYNKTMFDEAGLEYPNENWNLFFIFLFLPLYVFYAHLICILYIFVWFSYGKMSNTYVKMIIRTRHRHFSS